MNPQSLLINVGIAVGALIAGVLFRLLVGDAAIVLAPVLAAAAVTTAWIHTSTRAGRARNSSAEEADTEEASA